MVLLFLAGTEEFRMTSLMFLAVDDDLVMKASCLIIQ